MESSRRPVWLEQIKEGELWRKEKYPRARSVDHGFVNQHISFGFYSDYNGKSLLGLDGVVA